MAIHLLNKDIQSLSGSTLITFAKISSQNGAKKDSGKDKPPQISFPGLSDGLSLAIEEKTLTGKRLETISYRELNANGFRHVVIVGLGKPADLNHETIRQAFAAAHDASKALKTQEVFIDFDSIAPGKKDLESFAKAAAEGLVLASYAFDELKSKKPDAKAADEKNEIEFHVVSKNAKLAGFKKSFEEGLHIAQCVNFSRFLGDMPGNLMTPDILSKKTAEAAKGTGIKVTIWDKARIKKERMGGLLGVSNGSDQEPRFIIMEYKGAGKDKKPVCFVGKGLTFDCGGISIKPSAAMEEMKYDMCGGANVIGTMLAIAKLKLKINALAFIPATENLAGPSATKPGDIHTGRNGKTFEINNTDAEGRLILSDALTYACEQKPEVVIDAATLTGAMIIALGNIHTGYFTRNQELKKKIEKAGESSGEAVWNMPLVDHHVSDMKGTFADLSNISSGKGAGSATAAAFLEQFVEEGIPWAHFDIAGTGWAVGGRLNYCSKKGASGVMIRTFVELAKQFA